MKPTLVLLASILAAQALAAPPSQPWTETQALTRAAPTLATDGLGLTGAFAVRITVCAASGQTLSGAGTLNSYYLPVGATPLTDWALGSVTLTIPATAAGKKCFCFLDVPVLVRAGRALWAANGITVSGGTTVKLWVDVAVDR